MQLKNPRWERFCIAYVELGVGSEAYRRSGYRKGSPRSLSALSARLLTVACIKERITELRAKALLCHDITREELARFYSSAIVTPAGQVDANHPLCQSVEVSEKGTKIRLPDKNAAAAGLARLNGWDAASRIEVSVNPLTDYLRQLRAKTVDTNKVQAIDDQ